MIFLNSDRLRAWRSMNRLGSWCSSKNWITSMSSSGGMVFLIVRSRWKWLYLAQMRWCLRLVP